MTTVAGPTGSSPPNFRKSSQFSTTATSSVPPGFNTGRVDTRRRHDDSPPRIWDPKLLVRMAKYPSAAAALMSDSPAETMPSPPAPAMPMIKIVYHEWMQELVGRGTR